MSRNKITKDDHEPIRAAILGGENSEDVAARYGISRQRAEYIAKHPIRKRLKEGEIIDGLQDVKAALDAQDKRVKVLTLPNKAAIAHRYAEGLAREKCFVTARDISEYLGLHVSTVHQITRKRFVAPMAKAMMEAAK